MSFRCNLLGVLLSGLVASTAGAADPGDLGASFSITKTRTHSLAVLTLDPAAPVVDVVLDAPACNIAEMVEVEPGRWEGSSPLSFTADCVQATVTVFLRAHDAGGFLRAPCPFFGLNEVEMSGESHTDAYTSSEAPYAPETAAAAGDVCSNGDIRLSGSATIHGDAYVGAAGGLRTSGSAGVTGAVETLPAPYAPDPIDSTAAFFNDNSELPRTELGRDPIDRNGKLKLSGGDRLLLPPGTYFFTEVKLSGSSSLDVDGPVFIQTLDDFDASGGSVVNRSRLPGDLQIRVMHGDVKLSGGSDLHALVYAPEGEIKYSSHSDFYGLLVGEELKLSGSAGLHADAAAGGAAEESSLELSWQDEGITGPRR